jgi:HPt (histidine-containing phosphotransfer) domain-containing protein
MTMYMMLNQNMSKCINVFEQNNMKKLTELAHTLKGSSYTVGAVKVGDESLGIELSAKNNDVDSCRNRISQMKDVMAKTEEEIVKYINGKR